MDASSYFEATPGSDPLEVNSVRDSDPSEPLLTRKMAANDSDDPTTSAMISAACTGLEEWITVAAESSLPFFQTIAGAATLDPTKDNRKTTAETFIVEFICFIFMKPLFLR